MLDEQGKNWSVFIFTQPTVLYMKPSPSGKFLCISKESDILIFQNPDASEELHKIAPRGNPNATGHCNLSIYLLH